MSSSNTQHQRTNSLDPFSDPDIYYGDEDSLARIRDRRRAFSSVSYNMLTTYWRPGRFANYFGIIHIDFESIQPRRYSGSSGQNTCQER